MDQEQFRQLIERLSWSSWPNVGGMMFILPQHIDQRLRNSRERSITARLIHRGKLNRKNGVRVCVWCLTPITGKLLYWCKGTCSLEFEQLLPHNIKKHIFVRDDGRCRHCNKDLAALEARLKDIRTKLLQHHRFKMRAQRGALPDWDMREYTQLADWRIKCIAENTDLFSFNGFEYKLKHQTAYEIDHMVPHHLGGSPHPDNLQLLCTDCHQIKSANEAFDRAKRARSEVRHG